MDLGECRCVHDLALRADYEQAALTRDYYYDVDVSDFICYMTSIIFLIVYIGYLLVCMVSKLHVKSITA